MSKQITFRDEYQNFITFYIENDGYIKDVQPFKFNIWKHYRISNSRSLSVGGYMNLSYMKKVNLLNMQIEEKPKLKYKIESIERRTDLKKMVTYSIRDQAWLRKKLLRLQTNKQDYDDILNEYEQIKAQIQVRGLMDCNLENAGETRSLLLVNEIK